MKGPSVRIETGLNFLLHISGGIISVSVIENLRLDSMIVHDNFALSGEAHLLLIQIAWIYIQVLPRVSSDMGESLNL